MFTSCRFLLVFKQKAAFLCAKRPAGMRPTKVINDKGARQYIGDSSHDPDRYRLGAMYLCYKDYRFGVNSERVRNYWQNHVAHGDGLGFPIFRVMDNKVQFYSTFQTKNSFTTW